MELVPFVVDTLGGLGTGARGFYSVLANAARSHVGPCSLRDVVAHSRDAVQLVIQTAGDGLVRAAWSHTGRHMDKDDR